MALAPSPSAANLYYGSSQSVWSTNLVPTNNYPAYIPAELGIKFQVSQAGEITGLRFYKDAQNTGIHVGHIWDSSGDLLASLTFTNESTSGWQMAMFSAPVAVQTNTTYVVSYSTPTGAFSADQNYFNNPYTNGLITLPSSSQVGGNGVYSYVGPGTFPSQTYEASNYWVDIVFAPQLSSAASLTIWSDNVVPANNYGPYVPAELGEMFQVAQAGQIQGVRFYKDPQNTGTHTGRLWDAYGHLLASVTFAGESSAGWQNAYFSQPVTVQPYTSYIVSYSTLTGAFSVDLNYLNNSYSSGLITLLSSSQAGGNGLYSYLGGPGSFPTQTYEASNYWVDVLFLPGASSGCVPQTTYPNTNQYPSVAPSCPPPLPPNPNPPNSRTQDDGPIHPCMLIANGVRYQAIVISGLSGPYPVNSTLYFGPACSATQFADQVFNGQTVNLSPSFTLYVIHFWDEPATSAVWTVGNLTTQCIDYSQVSDCQ